MATHTTDDGIREELRQMLRDWHYDGEKILGAERARRFRPAPLHRTEDAAAEIETLQFEMFSCAVMAARLMGPESRELDHALTKLEEALYWMIAGIDRRASPPIPNDRGPLGNALRWR